MVNPMRRQLLGCSVIVLGLALAVPTAALAADDAKALYEEGVALFDEGKFADAADAFRRAYGLKPAWKLLYNIGQCEAAAKRHGLALEAFETYLSQGGDDVTDTRREQVLAEVERLRKMVGSVEVLAPEGAVVLVDGVERGKAPLLGKLPVAASVKHTASVILEGEPIGEKAFKVTGGDSTMIDFSETDDEAAAVVPEPEVSPKPSAEAVEPKPTQDEGRSPLVIAGWITTGVGAALLAGGAITGSQALKLDGQLADDCPGGECVCPDQDCYDKREEETDRLKKASGVTNILLGIGAGVAATGVVLLVLGYRGGEDDTEEPVALTPTVGPGFAGAAIQGRF